MLAEHEGRMFSGANMDLDDLRAFLAVVEAGSVTAAATRLHLSQPAVTRRLQRLEAELGVELFDRHAKPLAPTPAGRAALEKGRQILESIDGLVSLWNGQPSGPFRLGASLSFSALALARPIDELRRTFPRVMPYVTTGWSPALTDEVRDGTLDMAFIAHLEGKRPVADFPTVPLGTHPLVLVAPNSARVPKVAEPRMLGDATWVLNPEGCSFRQGLEHVLHQAGVKLRVAVAVYGWDLQLSLVARGLGFGLFPAWVVRRSRLRAKIRVFRLHGFDANVEFTSVHGHSLGRLEGVAKVLDQTLADQIRALR